MSSPLPDPHAVADQLHSAAIQLLRGLRRADAESGLTAARLSALSVIVFAGPVTLTRLAAAEQVSAPTMTRLVRAMEDDGLVRRSRDAADGRVAWIAATARGRRLMQEGRARRIALLRAQLEQLDARELSVLQEAAKSIFRLANDGGSRDR